MKFGFISGNKFLQWFGYSRCMMKTEGSDNDFVAETEKKITHM